MHDLSDIRIGIIGLGYVGLPLAVEFGRHFDTVGYDIDGGRVAQLAAGHDRTREVADADLAQPQLRYSAEAGALDDRNIYIVTVPTPIDDEQRPDLKPLINASAFVAMRLKRGDIVIYESTVYPGTTEEVCVPILEQGSGLRFNEDFHCGYSPERVNPGDHARRLPDIIKVTSGSDDATADFVDALYARIIRAGTHRAPSIRVAEAAKVIENIQRDVNIALVNELALVFDRLGIDTQDVLQAAGTKWNFLPFRPGLVGGHCIGVDPYYLIERADAAGIHPQLIHTARQINNRVGAHVAQRVAAMLEAKHIEPASVRVLVLGLTFKEDCPDLRNSKVLDVVAGLHDMGVAVDVHDPWADPALAHEEYGVELVDTLQAGRYDAIVLAVAHSQFRAMDAASIRALGKPGAVVYDVKSVWPRDAVDDRL
ncbi:nucleotide sugar dehydrogenase [Lysobacter oculi]|uniref:Nucleotide sugar dehydrogenase n=1 Tax=Solilutibacter oculi TaxID=2698682 RepID=A0A344J8U8_9GAMM|nr:nucleotide sugar dehydrogenase [Lysobacter oculi]AXA85458.1 nucleotide sugar dehydrogenase [Lysobacter oculi]